MHGFAVDDKASKMSKSVGNVINPEIITKGGENLNKDPAYGVDTLRSVKNIQSRALEVKISKVNKRKWIGGG